LEVVLRIEDVIARWITEGREASGMTQLQLGERLGEILGKPWPKQAVSAAEKGRRAFTAAELVAFAVALGCNVETLLQPPMDVDEVTLAEGHPVKSSYLRTVAATNTDLADLVTSMERLREVLVNTHRKAADTEKISGIAQGHLAQAYRDLRAALRGRGLAEEWGESHPTQSAEHE
jgi:transcriptional regulator with XRE-family HTH domain